MHASRQQNGFTLVELSVVLVVIGLLVGGVLTGQYLIQAAETRAVITDVERIRAAAIAFRTRFNDLPGDARNFRQFADLKKFPQTKNGNGDKRVQQCFENEAFSASAPNACAVYGSSWENLGGRSYDYLNQYTGELLGFWQHLSVAGMIMGDYNGLPAHYGGAGAPPANNRAKPGISYPAFRLNNSLGWVAYSGKYERGQLFLTPGVVSGYAVNAQNVITTPNSDPSLIINVALTPLQAHAIDFKGDDGMPKSGAIRGGTANGNGVMTINYPGLILGVFQRTEGKLFNNALNAADPCASFMTGEADYNSVNALDPIFISQHTRYNTASNWEGWASEMFTKQAESEVTIDQLEDSPACTMRFVIY